MFGLVLFETHSSIPTALAQFQSSFFHSAPSGSEPRANQPIGKRCLRGRRPIEPKRCKVRVGRMRERLAIIGRGRNSGSYYRVNRIAMGIHPRERGAPWPSGESDPRPRWVRFPARAIEDDFSPDEEV